MTASVWKAEVSCNALVFTGYRCGAVPGVALGTSSMCEARFDYSLLYAPYDARGRFGNTDAKTCN